MSSLSRAAIAWTLLSMPYTYASIQFQPNDFPFTKDNVNASVTVNFNGYNVTQPYSNSSEPTPWQARLKVRAEVSPAEVGDDAATYYMPLSQISWTYDVDDSDDVEEPDESWGHCVAMQPLFNITTNLTESIDPTCKGILGVECVEWLQRYVNDGGPCNYSISDEFVYSDIRTSVFCLDALFPEPGYRASDGVPTWARRTNLTEDKMSITYQGDSYEEGEDGTQSYDDLTSRVFVLLASWGERNESNTTQVDTDTVLNGTVLCLRANETAPGSRTLAEIVEDGATVLGGGIFTMTIVMASATLFAVLL